MKTQDSTRTVVIEAGRSERHYWRDIWAYRELLYFLALRDIVVRYKQTVIGVAWALLRPLATMLVFTLVFGRIADLPSQGAPYSLMVFCGMLPWFFFSGAVIDSTNSLVGNSQLLSKVYFPRLIIPMSAVAVALVDLAIGFVLLIVLMGWYGFPISVRVLALPALGLLGFAAALGISFWFSALNVRYRDFRFVVPFLLQFGLYVSPVGFTSELIPERWRLLYSINPMVPVIDGFRWALLGGTFKVHGDALVLSIFFTSAVLVSGIWFFRRMERSFADVI